MYLGRCKITVSSIEQALVGIFETKVSTYDSEEFYKKGLHVDENIDITKAQAAGYDKILNEQDFEK